MAGFDSLKLFLKKSYEEMLFYEDSAGELIIEKDNLNPYCS